MTHLERDKAIVQMVNKIAEKAKNGELQGEVNCPLCVGKISYVYYNDTAIAAKCNVCGLYLRA